MDELRTRLTLSDLVGKRVRLTRAGREFKGCCPFHKEKTPSFYVNDDKQFYHCFGCGAHGDAIGFLMQHDNLSFIDAIEQLAAQAGMEVPKASPQEVQRAKTQKDLHALLEETTRFFERTLEESEGRVALRYLNDRGVAEDLRQAFRLGYAPGDGQALRNHLKQQGYTDAQMIEAGVTRPSNRSTDPYAFFRDRIMFPVSDRRGWVVAFGGRILPEHLRPPERGDFKPPKYINSADNPLFHKGRMLYSESQARQAAADGQPVIVVEGYVDVMACFEAGYKGAVAPLGTALTEEQILSLWKMIPQDSKVPILCFDGDNAGRRAAARAVERILPLLKPDHSAQIAFLPEGEDPDSLIKARGRAAFQSILDGALSLADFIWSLHTEGQRFETPEARAGLEKKLFEEIAHIPDRAVQQYYRQIFKDRLYKFFAPARLNKKGGAPATALKLHRPLSGGGGRVLLAALINHPAIFDDVEEACGMLHLSDPQLDQLRQIVLDQLLAEPDLDTEGLRAYLLAQGYEEALTTILSDSVYVHAAFARPDTPLETVLEGWQDTLNHMLRRTA